MSDETGQSAECANPNCQHWYAEHDQVDGHCTYTWRKWCTCEAFVQVSR